MDWETVLGIVATFVVAVVTVGSVANIGLLTLASGPVVASGVVLLLVGASVFLTAAAGSKSPGWLSNPYW